jgi:nucleolar protein 4
MLSKKDAERALEGCNGKAIRAGLAEELVSAKQKKKKQLRLEKKMRGAPKEGAAAPDAEGEAEGEGEEEKEETGEDDKDERVIAVDWALSKEKWKEEMAKVEEKPAGSDVEMGEPSSGSEGESDSEDEGLGIHEDDDSDDESTSSRDGDEEFDRDTDEEEPTKPQLPAPEAGTTLFVRNVPHISPQKTNHGHCGYTFTGRVPTCRSFDVFRRFRAFGPLRYARITIDPGTGRSRGTGFACFWNKEDADNVVEQSEILRSETTGQSSAVCRPYPAHFRCLLISISPAKEESI